MGNLLGLWGRGEGGGKGEGREDGWEGEEKLDS